MQNRSSHRSPTTVFGVRLIFHLIVVLVGLTLGLNAVAAAHGGHGFYGGHASSGFHHFAGGRGFHGGHSSLGIRFGLGYYGFYPYLNYGWPSYYYPYRYAGYYPAYGYGVNYSAPSFSAVYASDPPIQNHQVTTTVTPPPPIQRPVTVINGQSISASAMSSANRLFGR